MPNTEERREFQRLELRQPISATLAATRVDIVDLGVLGARVEGASLPGDDQCTLVLEVEEGEISIDCEIVHRVQFDTTARHAAGVAFTAAHVGSDTRLRALLTRLVLAELKTMTAAAPKLPSFDPEQTAMRIPAPFTTHRLGENGWSKRAAFLAVQPENGFTLPAFIRTAEAERLRKEFEIASAEDRRLIRLFAELRVSEVLHLPPSR